VLIKGETLVGIFDTWEEARSVGLQRFGVVPMLVQEILRWYKPLRTAWRWSRRCCTPRSAGGPIRIGASIRLLRPRTARRRDGRRWEQTYGDGLSGGGAAPTP
jgi:hypothetical protein